MEATPTSLRDRRRTMSAPIPNGIPSHGVHESLIAVCMLVVASLALGIILYALSDILIPLAFSLLFYYILQPVVTFLTKPPAVCITDLFKGSDDLPVSERCRRFFGWSPQGKGKGRKDSYAYGTVEEAMPIQAESEGWRETGRGTGQPTGQRRTPCRRILFSLRCPRWLAIILAISLAVGFFVMFGFMIYSAVISIENDWASYEAGAERLARQLKAVLAKIHVSLDDDLVPYVMDGVKSYIPRLIAGVWLVIANGFLVSIFLLYLLSAPPQPLPPGVWRTIDTHIRRYIRLKTFICLVVGSVAFVILYLLNVPFAGLFGFITFILNFIPNFGPIMATLLPLPLVAFTTHMSLEAKVLSIVLPACAHFLCGYWLEPQLFGEHLELHPIIILIALAFWGVLWGVVGMVLSVPLISLIKIISQHLHHPYAKVVVRVLEGRMIDFDVHASISAYHQVSGSQGGIVMPDQENDV